MAPATISRAFIMGTTAELVVWQFSEPSLR